MCIRCMVMCGCACVGVLVWVYLCGCTCVGVLVCVYTVYGYVWVCLRGCAYVGVYVGELVWVYVCVGLRFIYMYRHLQYKVEHHLHLHLLPPWVV